MEMKKSKSSFERVIGNLSEAQKGEILQEKGEIFDNQIFEELKGRERLKSPEEIQIISLANDLTNEIRIRYGLESFDVPTDNIHIIRDEHWPKRMADSGAYYSPKFQGVASKENFIKISFMKRTLHEMIHFKSYNALQSTKEEKSNISEYRVGLTVTTRNGKDRHLGSLNEAVTEEIAKKIMSKNYLNLSKNPLFTAEIEDSQKIIRENPQFTAKSGKPLFNEDTLHASIRKESKKNPDDTWTTKIEIGTENFTYKPERQNLSTLINKIFERNPERFHDKEEIFDIFAKGMITGNILPLGKLIDKTFGRGAFDKLSELDKKKLGAEQDARSIDEQKKFIESL